MGRLPDVAQDLALRAMGDRTRIITPYTDPARFTPEEKTLFNQGRCCRQDFDPTGRPEYCGRPSRTGASFGHCPGCEAEFLKDYWPNGSPRR